MAGPPDDGEPWDDSEWVDVGPDDRWRPTFEERSRSFVVLVVLGMALLLAAAVASLGGDDDEPTASSGTTSSTTETTIETTTSSTAPADPASIEGEDPPPGCETDDRDAAPMRPRSASTVLVLNGTPRAGHAGDTTEALAEQGYATMTPGNADIRDATTIGYAPGYCAEAARLVIELGIPGVAYDPVPEDVFLGRAALLLTVGRDSL